MGTSGDQAGLSPWLSGQRNHLQCRRHMSFEFDPWVEKTPWRRKWQLPLVFLSEKSYGQRILAGYGPKRQTQCECLGTYPRSWEIITETPQKILFVMNFQSTTIFPPDLCSAWRTPCSSPSWTVFPSHVNITSASKSAMIC